MLIEGFIDLLGSVTLEQIQAKNDLNLELKRFQRILLARNINSGNQEDIEFNPVSFVRYIFSEGSREEKRALIESLDSTLYLEDGEILVNI